jgi:hypothetical protein
MRDVANRSGIWASFALLGSLWWTVGAAVAAPVLVLSSPDNLSNLHIADEFRIDVALEGLEVGSNFVFDLNSRLLFPGALVDPVLDPTTASGLTPGAILVTAAQRSSFDAVSSLTDGVVTGNFSDLAPVASQAISQNGTYFSFLLEATDVGSDMISFDPANTTFAADSTGSNLAPLPTGNALEIRIVPVPAPPSLLLLGVGTMLGLGWMRRR